MMSGRTGISLLRVVLGIVLAWYSAHLAVAQIHGRMHLHMLVLGLAELIAAILFLMPGTMRAGGVALLVIFGAAAALHLAHAEYDVGYLAVYAAGVAAVLSNGGRT